MKIVHLIQRYTPAIGGCEQWCQQISRYLVKEGHQVKVLTTRVYHEEEFFTDLSFDRRTAVLGKIDNDQGVPVYRYRRTKIHPWVHRYLLEGLLDKRLGFYFYGPHSISMYLDIPRKIINADVVHLHGMHYPHNFIGFLWAKLLGKKVVMIPHFHPGHPYYERSSHYWLMRHCDLVITVSVLEKEHLVKNGIDGNKIVALGNSIDPGEYQPDYLEEFKADFYQRYQIQENEKIVTFLGRRVEYKGLEHLIQAAWALNEEDSKVRLLIIGPSFQWFDKFYDSLPLEKKRQIIDLKVIPHQEKVNLLHLSDMVVLPSQYEAFGIVFLEAWACGVPVIGTMEGAMAQLIDGGGRTVPYGDVGKLREAIQFLISNPAIAKSMAEHGRQKVMQEYTVNTMGEGMLTAYHRVMNLC